MRAIQQRKHADFFCPVPHRHKAVSFPVAVRLADELLLQLRFHSRIMHPVINAGIRAQQQPLGRVAEGLCLLPHQFLNLLPRQHLAVLPHRKGLFISRILPLPVQIQRF